MSGPTAVDAARTEHGVWHAMYRVHLKLSPFTGCGCTGADLCADGRRLDRLADDAGLRWQNAESRLMREVPDAAATLGVRPTSNLMDSAQPTGGAPFRKHEPLRTPRSVPFVPVRSARLPVLGRAGTLTPTTDRKE